MFTALPCLACFFAGIVTEVASTCDLRDCTDKAAVQYYVQEALVRRAGLPACLPAHPTVLHR